MTTNAQSRTDALPEGATIVARPGLAEAATQLALRKTVQFAVSVEAIVDLALTRTNRLISSSYKAGQVRGVINQLMQAVAEESYVEGFAAGQEFERNSEGDN